MNDVEDRTSADDSQNDTLWSRQILSPEVPVTVIFTSQNLYTYFTQAQPFTAGMCRLVDPGFELL